MTKSNHKGGNIILDQINRIRKKRFAYLTISLLLLIVLYPYVQGDSWGQVFLSLLATIVMITSVIAVGDKIFMHIIKSREVTTEILFASISVYMLIGLSWATIYIMINSYHPGSFVDRDGTFINAGPDFLFFSYITLTTVGYGNIEAVSNQARSVASIEALCGQLYLTIMVARLVGLHISKPKIKESTA